MAVLNFTFMSIYQIDRTENIEDEVVYANPLVKAFPQHTRGYRQHISKVTPPFQWI